MARCSVRKRKAIAAIALIFRHQEKKEQEDVLKTGVSNAALDCGITASVS